MPAPPPSPLAGRRIVVTRAATQATELLALLRHEGAEAIALPTIAFAPPLDEAPLLAALRDLPAFAGCVFTSTNAVQAVFARADALALAPPTGWIAAVGPATAAALRVRPGWTPAILPATPSAAGVAAALAGHTLAAQRILFPRADGAGDLIPRVLQQRGAVVVNPVAYRTILDESSREAALRTFPGADAAVFTSPSTARNLATLLGGDHAARLASVAIVAIGPVTETAVTQFGWHVTATASQPDAASIVAALRSCWRA